MKKIFLLVFGVVSLFWSDFAIGGDVYVNGYVRKDGTYVAPHYRSRPDSQRWNNYGPSKKRGRTTYPSYTTPATRDYDGDGLSNRYDMDDDNDGILDQYDGSQYNKRKGSFGYGLLGR